MNNSIRCVYIAGTPVNSDEITGDTLEVVTAKALAMHGLVPYLPNIWHHVASDDLINHHLEWLSRCDALLVMPESAAISSREINFARRHNVPIFHSIDHILGVQDAKPATA